MLIYLLFVLFISWPSCIAEQGLNTKKFPENFLFGTGTSAYQIEGAWNESGKGESLWDRIIHENPTYVEDHSNADIACDSYHKYEEDVILLKNLGVDFYRFSVSWSRILPEGFANRINPDGIRYYNNLINLLLENDITPMITILHFDMPQVVHELVRGFVNPLIVDLFAEYSRILFENFGDRVKLWLTFNEPFYMCAAGYAFHIRPPDYNYSTDYNCMRNLLKSHASVYHLYDDIYRSTQKGKISIALSSEWYEPVSNLIVDIQAAERVLEFLFVFYGDPIFGKTTDYSQYLKELVSNCSTSGFPLSTLLGFNNDEMNYINGTFDYFALNHYSTVLVAARKGDTIEGLSLRKQLQVEFSTDPSWKSAAIDSRKVVPWGFRKLLSWIKKRYGNPEIIVTENGYADHGNLNDQERIDFHRVYLSALLDAIYEDKVNVTAYTAWSLLDNFEWHHGYVPRFGLHHVNFSDPNRARTAKTSANYYKQVIKNRRIMTEHSSVAQACSNVWLFVTVLVAVVYDCY